MSRKRWLALIAVAMLVVASISFNMLTVSNSGILDSMGKEWTESIIEHGADPGGSIVVIEVSGVIADTNDLFSDYRHQPLLDQLDHAMEDPLIQGVILRVDTPGGGVLESAEIHEKVVRIKEEFKKPIFVSMGNMAASGGYYIAAPADKIVASPQTITGSIGVIMESINVSQLAEKYGVQVNTIKSGPHKDMMSSTREMTEEERAILQSLIDESYEEFVRIVANGRKMSDQAVREIADGRIYSGKQAYELNLVDELGSLDDTIELMKNHIGADFDVIKYESSFGFGQLFSVSMERMLNRSSDLVTVERLLSDYRSPTLKYLYAD